MRRHWRRSGVFIVNFGSLKGEDQNISFYENFVVTFGFPKCLLTFGCAYL